MAGQCCIALVFYAFCMYIIGLTGRRLDQIKLLSRLPVPRRAAGAIARAQRHVYVFTVIAELRQPQLSLRSLDEKDPHCNIIQLTDAKSLESCVNSDTGVIQDKRLRIVVCMLRETVARTVDKVTLKWIPTWLMLADALTKFVLGAAVRAAMGCRPYAPQPLTKRGASLGLAALAFGVSQTKAASEEVALKVPLSDAGAPEYITITINMSADVAIKLGVLLLLLLLTLMAVVSAWVWCVWQRRRPVLGRGVVSFASDASAPSPRLVATEAVTSHTGRQSGAEETFEFSRANQPAPTSTAGNWLDELDDELDEELDPSLAPVAPERCAAGAAEPIRVVPRVAPECSTFGRTRPTPQMEYAELLECLQQGHSLRPGRNQYSVFLTCRMCRRHVTWKRGSSPTWREYPELARLLDGEWAQLQHARR